MTKLTVLTGGAKAKPRHRKTRMAPVSRLFLVEGVRHVAPAKTIESKPLRP